MHIVSTAWIDATLEEFELSVGLSLHAAHGRASAAAPLRVFVLTGFDKITPAYAAHLAAGHVLVEDAGPLLARWSSLLPHIGERVNRYETKCFLRWPILREAMGGDPFVHIDLDLFLQPRFETLLAAVEGRGGTSAARASSWRPTATGSMPGATRSSRWTATRTRRRRGCFPWARPGAGGSAATSN